MKHQLGIRFGITLATLACSAIAATLPAQAVQFRDTDSHWAEEYIDSLSEIGVLGGFPDGSFRPNARVTRAQFATIANKIFQLQSNSANSPFRDVPNSHWAAGNIAAASFSGLVAGFPDGNFRPEQNVTRAQSLVVMVNGLETSGFGDRAVPASGINGWLQPYQDANTIPAWAARNLATATKLDLAVNYPNSSWLEPNRNATRGEVAAFAYQTLVQLGSVPPIAQNPAATVRSNSVSQQSVSIQQSVGGQTSTDQNSTQQFQTQALETILVGTRFRAISQSERTFYLNPNETKAFSLVLDDNIRSASGAAIFPIGSRIDGRFESVPGGLQFIAERVNIGDRSFPLVAQSDVLSDVKDPRQMTPVNVIGDAAIGAAAGAVISGVVGDRAIATEEVLGGAAAGVVIGNAVAPRVVVLDSDRPLDLRITQEFLGPRL